MLSVSVCRLYRVVVPVAEWWHKMLPWQHLLLQQWHPLLWLHLVSFDWLEFVVFSRLSAFYLFVYTFMLFLQCSYYFVTSLHGDDTVVLLLFTNMKRNKASTNDSYEIPHFSSLILNVKILLLFYRSRFYRYSSYKCQEGGFNKQMFSLRDVNKISSLLSG